MPVDHRMLLQKPPEMDLATPLNMYMNMKAERRAQQEQEYVQRQRVKQEQKASDMQNLATMFQGDREGYLSNLAAKYPMEAMKQQQEFAVQDKTQLELLKLRREDTDSQKKRKGMWAKNILESENPTFAFENAVMGMNEEGLELPPYYLDGNLTPEIAQELQMAAREAEEADDTADYGLNIEYGRDPQGNIIPMQASRKGGLVRAKMPEEVVEFDPGLKYVKQGGKILGKDKFGKVRDTIDVTLTPKQKADVALDWRKAENEDTKLALLEEKWDFTKQKQATKKLKSKADKRLAAQTVVEDMGRGIVVLEKNMRRKGFPTTAAGIIAVMAKHIPSSDADVLDKYAESVKSNISIDRLQAMREGSPTGGALGQVPVQQQVFLMQLLGSLAVEQKPEILLDNMKRISNIYMDIVHGIGQGGKRYKISFDEYGKPVPGGRAWTGTEYSDTMRENLTAPDAEEVFEQEVMDEIDGL